jgi:hypothetical protein
MNKLAEEHIDIGKCGGVTSREESVTYKMGERLDVLEVFMYISISFYLLDFVLFIIKRFI